MIDSGPDAGQQQQNEEEEMSTEWEHNPMISALTEIFDKHGMLPVDPSLMFDLSMFVCDQKIGVADRIIENAKNAD